MRGALLAPFGWPSEHCEVSKVTILPRNGADCDPIAVRSTAASLFALYQRDTYPRTVQCKRSRRAWGYVAGTGGACWQRVHRASNLKRSMTALGTFKMIARPFRTIFAAISTN